MFIFDYLTFLDYYSNTKNLQKDSIGVGPLYYFINKNKPAKIVNLLDYYITVDGVKIYVKILPNKRHPTRVPAVLFTVPTIINNIMYDVHYHFGENSENDITTGKIIEINIRKNNESTFKKYSNRKNKNKSKKYSVKNTNNKIKILNSESLSDENIIPIYPIEEIYFHKTIQIPTETNFLLGDSEHIHCKFNNSILIDDVYKIICNPEKNEKSNILRTMERTFSPSELIQIREIISKPFRHQKKGGKMQIRTRSRTRTFGKTRKNINKTCK